MLERHSEADVPVLISDPIQAAEVESENALRQFDAAMQILDSWLSGDRQIIRPSQILRLHGILLDRLSSYAGNYRPASVDIKGSRHNPPDAQDVPGFIEELCDYLNENWTSKSAIHLSAYTLWRLNWIHAFVDGNGRTARVFSYLVLCAHCGSKLPGDLTIPEQIAACKRPYYDGLEAADRWNKRGKIDLSELEELLSAHLANQLYDFHKSVAGQGVAVSSEIESVLQEAQSKGMKDRRTIFTLDHDASSKPKIKSTVLLWMETHPALVGLIGVLATAVISAFVSIYFGK